MSTAQPKKFTRAEVEHHVESLNHLLKDVGPEISKALTQLVLNKPAASKQEALEFLATHLAASSAPGDVDLIKAVKADDEVGNNMSTTDANLSQAAIEHGAPKPAKEELEVTMSAPAETNSADVAAEPQPATAGLADAAPVVSEMPVDAPAGSSEAEPAPTTPAPPVEAVEEAAPAAVAEEPAADAEPKQPAPEAPLPQEDVEKLSPIEPLPQDAAAAESFHTGPSDCQAEAAGAGTAPAVPAVQPQGEEQQAANPEANAEADRPVLDQQGEGQATVEAVAPTTTIMAPGGEAPTGAVETSGSSAQAVIAEEAAPDVPLAATGDTPAEASTPGLTGEEPAVSGLAAGEEPEASLAVQEAAREDAASLPALASGEGTAPLPAVEPAQEAAVPVPDVEPAQEAAVPVPVEEPAQEATPLHAENPAEVATIPVSAIEPVEEPAPMAAVVPAEEMPSAAVVGEVVSQPAEQACTPEEAPTLLPTEEGTIVTAEGAAPPHTTEGHTAATPAGADGVTDQQAAAEPAAGSAADTQGMTAAVEGGAVGTPAVE